MERSGSPAAADGSDYVIPNRRIEFSAMNQFKALWIKSWRNQVRLRPRFAPLTSNQMRKYKTNAIQAIFPMGLVRIDGQMLLPSAFLFQSFSPASYSGFVSFTLMQVFALFAFQLIITDIIQSDPFQGKYIPEQLRPQLIPNLLLFGHSVACEFKFILLQRTARSLSVCSSHKLPEWPRPVHSTAIAVGKRFLPFLSHSQTGRSWSLSRLKPRSIGIEVSWVVE